MRATDALGEFEHAVLLAVAHLGPDSYGVPIRKLIEDRTGRTIAIGALYTALDRLERKGYVSSRMSEPTAERGGRSRRHVRMRPAGADALRRSRDYLDRMWRGLDPSLKAERR